MKKTFALAACAALSLAVAACGDDDDDASGDTTELSTPEAPDTEAGDTDPGDTAASDTAASDTDAADAGAATDPAGTLSGEDADLVADCEAFQSILETDVENEPAVGEEITDEYRETLESYQGQLEDLDLNTDLADGARDAFGDVIDEVADSDTMPEDVFGGETPDAITEFGERCQALLGTGG